MYQLKSQKNSFMPLYNVNETSHYIGYVMRLHNERQIKAKINVQKLHKDGVPANYTLSRSLRTLKNL